MPVRANAGGTRHLLVRSQRAHGAIHKGLAACQGHTTLPVRCDDAAKIRVIVFVGKRIGRAAVANHRPAVPRPHTRHSRSDQSATKRSNTIRAGNSLSRPRTHRTWGAVAAKTRTKQQTSRRAAHDHGSAQSRGSVVQLESVRTAAPERLACGGSPPSWLR